MGLPHLVFTGPEATGHDHPAVLLQGLADRLEGFLHRRVDKAAGVDHHQIGGFVGGRDLVTLGPQLSQDAFGIDQGLRAPQADEPDAWGLGRRDAEGWVCGEAAGSVLEEEAPGSGPTQVTDGCCQEGDQAPPSDPVAEARSRRWISARSPRA